MKNLTIVTYIVVPLLIAIIIATGSVLYVTADTDNDEIVACVSKATGLTRILGDETRSKRCLKSEYRVTWNQAGETGPQGAQGLPGVAGPVGPQGPAGENTTDDDRFNTLEARILALETLLAQEDDESEEEEDGTNEGEPYEATLKLSLSSSNPDATDIIVDTDADTNDVTIMVADVEAEDGDITLGKVVVKIETGVAKTTNVIDDVRVIINGQEFDAENVTGVGVPLSESKHVDATETATWYVFDINEEVTIDGDTTEAMEVVVDLNDTDDGMRYPNGTSIQASVTSVERDYWEAEGYDDLAPSEFAGVAIGDVHSLVSKGILLPADGFSSEVDVLGQNENIGQFTLEFEVTAIEGDFYIAETATTSTNNVTHGVAYIIEGSGSTDATASLSSTADEDVSGVFTVREGETETFTLTVTLYPEIAGAYRVRLDKVWYTENSNGVTDALSYQPTPITSYRTPYANINTN